MDLGGLDVLLVHTGVADVRVGQRDDLAAVARVGEDFLVAGHRGVEHHLADGVAGSAEGMALKHRAICEGEESGGQNGQHGDSPLVLAQLGHFLRPLSEWQRRAWFPVEETTEVSSGQADCG
jgi:hypothetical protein